MIDRDLIREKFQAIRPVLNERARRLWAAAEARSLGRGGISAVAAATGIARDTVRLGLRELGEPTTEGEAEPIPLRVRHPGAGRKPLTSTDASLLGDLQSLVESTTRGDPRSPLRWTCKSTRRLAEELRERGHQVGRTTVHELLERLGYSLQSNRKTREGESHPDRDAQFEYINRQAKLFQRLGQPVVSVDTKKKELVGDFKNGGREWRPKGHPEEVRVHDFQDPALGKAIPYGVYDLTANVGWVSVGVDHDTAEFAVATLRRWWSMMGRPLYPRAAELLVMADGGGSNGSRNRLWKVALAAMARETGLRIKVCHFPPGTSKWNKIEHRMFCHITQNWRGRPLVSHEVIVNLIGETTTSKGLEIRAELDQEAYPKGKKVTDEELARVKIQRARFHGDWNYTVLPEQN
jgi:hypothetical protein